MSQVPEDALLPRGLKVVLDGFSRAVVKAQPENIMAFSAFYFQELLHFREGLFVCCTGYRTSFSAAAALPPPPPPSSPSFSLPLPSPPPPSPFSLSLPSSPESC